MVAHEDKKLSDWVEFCVQRKVSLQLYFATSWSKYFEVKRG